VLGDSGIAFVASVWHDAGVMCTTLRFPALAKVMRYRCTYVFIYNDFRCSAANLRADIPGLIDFVR
jgi:hypothetical protein